MLKFSLFRFLYGTFFVVIPSLYFYYNTFLKTLNVKFMDNLPFLRAVITFLFLVICLITFWMIIDSKKKHKNELANNSLLNLRISEAIKIVTHLISQRNEILDSSPERNFRIEREKRQMELELKSKFPNITVQELDNLIETYYPDKPNINFMH